MHLTDVFLEIFTFVRLLTGSPEVAQADYETVRRDMDTLIHRMTARARSAKVTTEAFDEARFAVFAWVDEAVLCSDWSGAGQWLKAPLQREYYRTANAGEEFYERLDRLLPAAASDGESLLADFAKENGDRPSGDGGGSEVLAVYAQCLALGFTGKYFNDGSGSLEALRADCVSRILGRQGGQSLAAFPQAYGVDAGVQRRPRHGRVFDPLSVVFAVLPVLVALGVYLAYNGLLEYNLMKWFG